MSSRRIVMVLWYVLVISQVAHARSSNSTTKALTSSTAAPIVTTTTPTATNSSASAEVQKTPIGTVAAAGSSTTTTTTTTSSTTTDTAYICSGDEVARLAKLNEKNPYLLTGCTSSAGVSSYAFPFNGELSYAQMVAMSAVSQCGYYFRAVLLVQLRECVDANVYIRTTAETILQLANTSGEAPTEADVNAAIAVRKAYNLALRDGDGSASYFATSGASSLSWNIEGETIDTTATASITGQLLLSTDLQVIGTYYASSNSSSDSITSRIEDSRTPGQSISSSSTISRGISAWLVVLVVIYLLRSS